MDNKLNSLFNRHYKSLKEIPDERRTVTNYFNYSDYPVVIR